MPVADEYRTKIAEAGMASKRLESELDRFERIGEQGPESSVIRTYLDWLLAVPWAERSEERLDPANAREVLDADHYGLDDVKERMSSTSPSASSARSAASRPTGGAAPS